MQQRDKHFSAGGSELTAPQYIYYDKLYFMRDFSLKKGDFNRENRIFNQIVDISPERLLSPSEKMQGEDIKYKDYTESFLHLVEQCPMLYDDHAEMRKYRGKDEWRRISEELGCRFTVGRLRNYWISLMRKYKLYLANTCATYGEVENEYIFQLMAFANEGTNLKESSTVSSVPETFVFAQEDDSEHDDESTNKYVEEERIPKPNHEIFTNEEHVVCEDVESSDGGEFIDIPEKDLENHAQTEDYNEIYESESEEPPAKQAKHEHQSDEDHENPQFPTTVPSSFIFFKNQQPVKSPAPQSPTHTIALKQEVEDEFDLIGKRVASQLRSLAQKSIKVARRAEIKCLQTLMEYEE